jgi:hypothetical protein
MKFFSGRRKKKEVDKTQEPKEKAVDMQSYRIPEAEMKSAEIMAARLASTKTIAEFCQKKGLGNPQEAFMRFYVGINQNRALWQLETRAEAAAGAAGKEFNREVFYGKLFMKCNGNPLNASSLLFKR